MYFISLGFDNSSVLSLVHKHFLKIEHMIAKLRSTNAAKS